MIYYQSESCTLYHGDALDVLPTMEAGSVDAIVTDPVWPNAKVLMAGHEDPYGLFKAAAREFPRLTQRLVVQMGCDSDPRFLDGVPKSMPFFRVCWLTYAVPSYKGRVLYTGDVGYVFGQPPPPSKGRIVLPGSFISTRYDKLFARKNGRNKRFTRSDDSGLPHPSPRRLQHVMWLVDWFGGPVILDPFMGSGTTGVACVQLGRRFIGIEIEKKYMDIAVRRIKDAESQMRLPFEASEPVTRAKQQDLPFSPLVNGTNGKGL